MNAQLWKQTMKFDGEPVLLVSIRRPMLGAECRTHRRVDRYHEQLATAWKARWEGLLYSRACEALTQARAAALPFQPWSACLDFTVTLETESQLSLFLDAVERGPTPRPLTVRSGSSWDLTHGCPLSLGEVLPYGLHRKDLLDFLRRQTESLLLSGETLLYPDAPRRSQRQFSPRRFYLTTTGPVFYYPMLSLGATGEGIPTFPLPPNLPTAKTKSKKIH